MRPGFVVRGPGGRVKFGGRSTCAVLLVVALLLFVVVRKAWVTDDAYITFRAIKNLFDGYGPVWNVGERVQVFTHPLWMMAMSAAHALTREFFYAAITLNLALTLAAAMVLAFRLARSWSAACLGLGLLAASRAFTDFATSGLENALLHLLLAVLLVLDDGARTRASAARFSFVAALCLLTRLDSLFLIAPAWVLVVRRVGLRRAAPAVIAGMAPFVAWELFSFLYYGSWLPNSALAKLNHGLPPGEMVVQGGHYLLNSLRWDVVTLAGVALGVFAGVRGLRGGQDRQGATDARPASPWAWAAGVLLMLAYVVGVGGDFMSGRFLTAPLLVSVGILVARPLPPLPSRLIAAALATLFLLPWTSSLPDRDYGPQWHAAIDDDGIADERSYYTRIGSLRASWGEKNWPDPPRYRDAVQLKRDWPADPFADTLVQLGGLDAADHWPPPSPRDENGKPYRMTVIRGAVGFIGYHLGPSVHVLDYHGLGDPLLARLPATVPDPILRDRIPRLKSLGWRIGHYFRRPPVGYARTLASGRNEIRDPDIARYYDVIRCITRDPVFDRQRLKTLWKFQFGAYEDLRRRAAAASGRLYSGSNNPAASDPSSPAR